MENINRVYGIVVRIAQDHTDHTAVNALVAVKETQDVHIIGVHPFTQIGDLLELVELTAKADVVTYKVSRNLTQRDEVTEAQQWLTQVTLPTKKS